MTEPQKPEKVDLEPNQLAILQREIRARPIAGRMHSPSWRWNDPPEEIELRSEFTPILPTRDNQFEHFQFEPIEEIDYAPNTDDPEGAA